MSLSYITGMGGVLEDVYQRINGTDFLVITGNDPVSKNKTADIINGNPATGDYEITEGLSGTAKYGHPGDKELTEYGFLFYSYDRDIRIQKISIPTAGFHGKDVVLPSSRAVEYGIGDLFRVKIGDNVYDLTVAGYAEDTLYCSPMNMGVYVLYVSEDLYEDLKFENPVALEERAFHKVRLSKAAKKSHTDPDVISDGIFSEFSDWYADYLIDHPEHVGGIYNAVTYQMLKGAGMILPMMFIAIVFVFALIIFIIAMVIIHFSVKNFIMTNMKNTAIMEASGYTVRELVIILLVQLLSVTFIGGLAGSFLGAILVNRLGVIILMTLGLFWNRPVNCLIIFGTVGGLMLIVSLLTLFISRDYRKTTVLEALRGGINAHNFKKNHFPFEKSVFNVPLTLALKETFGRFRSQLGMIFIVAILTISTVIGFGMSDTFSDRRSIMNMAGYDTVDAEVSGDRMMEKALSSMTTVSYVYGEVWDGLNYTSRKVRKSQAISTRCFTDSSLVNGLSIAEGRMPKHGNEIMFATNAATRMKVSVGDAVTIKKGSREESYIVTGLCQTINNLGMMAYLTVEGMEKISGRVDRLGYEVFLKDGYRLEDFIKEFHEQYPDEEVVDFEQVTEQIVGLVKGGIKAVAILIAILTVVIVAFVESLIIRTQITRSWRDLGVSKALGYTSGQLIVQTMLSNMPSVLIGVGIGLAASGFSGDKVMKFMFAIFGFRKSPFFILPASYVYAMIMIIVIAMGTSALIGRRIRKLEPVKMITEE